MHRFAIMRIVYLIVALKVFDTAAFAFTKSKLKHATQYLHESRCHGHRVATTNGSFQQSIRSSEATSANIKPLIFSIELQALKNSFDDSLKRFSLGQSATIFQVVVAAIVLVAATGSPAFADEYGVEKEAPTLYTGETVEICTKRGPLGACLKTEQRTSENDNDVSKKYFRDPSSIIQQQKVAILQKSDQDNDDGNALIQKLRQQSEDNREKNDLYVARKTFEADQSATFGPFDRQVLIMNTDGKTYTLLDNPVAMRLKKAGFIDNRRSFITQPSQEDLDAASEKEPGFFSNFLGGGSN